MAQYLHLPPNSMIRFLSSTLLVAVVLIIVLVSALVQDARDDKQDANTQKIIDFINRANE